MIGRGRNPESIRVPRHTHCRICGAPLEPLARERTTVATRHGYCSPACAGATDRTPHACRRCGGLILSGHGSRRYCSPECHRLARQAAKNVQRRGSRVRVKGLNLGRRPRIYSPTIRWCCGLPYQFCVMNPTACPQCGDTGLVRRGVA